MSKFKLETQNQIKKNLLIVISILLITNRTGQGFLKTEGKNIVDQNNNS